MVDNLSRQVEEIEALCSIYSREWKTEDEVDRTYSIKIEEGIQTAVLYVTLPADYPAASPPQYQLSAPTLGAQEKTKISSELDQIYLENIGETVIFQWIEKVRELLCNMQASEAPEEEDEDERGGGCNEVMSACSVGQHIVRPTIIHGTVITDRKSVFQGHTAIVRNTEEVSQVLEELYQNKKIAHATHNMYAYRICKEDTKCCIQDCNDDGEAQGGSRLLHLLQILHLQDIMVVVTRWYGGVHLGPDRFRHIGNAARQVLDIAGLIEPSNQQKKSRKKETS
ncbi:protein IMPACT-like [Zootermopsis nevadensis]|uniref:Protein IMPACT-B n=1 Tax=Zootermopsis nevadensis TaxID=136037 RepID=A0A067RFM4_ZOONE|nr:protein IMPACT-like [Zootermopsis nevadensis]KDR22562.1 Protein IMPACT-B [Zootermopsis nevadensis]